MSQERTETGSSAEERRAHIASGLGRSSGELVPLRAGEEAGEERGARFYTLALSDLDLAVREDGLCAYITRLAHELSPEGVSALLTEAGLVQVHVPTFRKVRSPSAETGGQKWIRVAEGTPPQSPDVEFFWPRRAQPLPARDLRRLSSFLAVLFDSAELDEETASQLRVPLALPGDVLARPLTTGKPGCDIFGRPIPPPAQAEPLPAAGEGLFALEDGRLCAARTGYPVLRSGHLSLRSPLWVAPDQMRVFFVLLDPETRPATAETIHTCLQQEGVVEGVRPEGVAQAQAALNRGEAGALILLAEGTEPEHGRDAQLELAVPINGHQQDQRPPRVRANQLVARRFPATAGIPGRTVRGALLPPRPGAERTVRARANLWIENGKDGQDEYFAGEDGLLKVAEDELAVIELLELKGDVNFKTGNLNFHGEIIIEGSVRPAFSVDAGEDIIVTGHIEPGAAVKAREDVIVGEGIVGRRTRVMAGGRVCARFVRDARVVAAEDVHIEEYARYAELHAGGRIVIGGHNGHDGAIFGGQVWAQRGIVVCNAGAAIGVPTVLVAGLAPEQAQQLTRLEEQQQRCYAQILRLLNHFYLQRIDVVQIRNLIAAATGPRRKLLAAHAHQLGSLVQVYQKRLDERRNLQEAIGQNLREAEIRVLGTAFPGVTIRLGDQELTLTEERANARFYLEGDRIRGHHSE